MRTLISIIIILTIIGCNQGPTPKVMLTDDLKYSAFYWHYNQQKNENEFYLDHYINIKKNGTYVLMRHEDWMGKKIYSNGMVDSNLLNFIDSIFLNNNYQSDYSINFENPVMYDGLTYCFDYSLKGGKNIEIQFIPPYSPDKLKLLSSMFDTLILNAFKNSLDTLPLKSYEDRLAKISLPNLPPLPLPPPPIQKNQKLFNPANYKL